MTPDLAANLNVVSIEIVQHALTRRRPDSDLVRAWHRRMFEGIPVPYDEFRGGFRGDSHPRLAHCAIQVGGIPAVPPRLVAREMRTLVTWLRSELPHLDHLERLALAEGAETKKRRLHLHNEVILTAAHVHGEWVRIHPFEDGNGRTARMWVLWLTSRYCLPPLLPLRTRPRPPYGDVSRASLASGDHTGMATLLQQIYAGLP